MAAGHHEPTLLFSVPNIKAYHIANGEEQSLTPTPSTLSLLMIPTDSSFNDLSTTIPQNDAPDQDFYLHLNLPPELDLPMPATTQIYHQPPNSYLIPRWDLAREAGAFTRIEFPPIGQGTTQEDVDTFETILAQCTAFLERARPPLPPRSSDKQPAYRPADYAPGGQFADTKGLEPGQIVLIDEDDGSIVGELGDEAEIVEDSRLEMGSKAPVEVQVSADGKRIDVRPISEDYLLLANSAPYRNSELVQRAATASRLIVTGSEYLSNLLTSQAESFTRKTQPDPKPLVFSPATHAQVRRLNSFTGRAAGLSSKTAGKLTQYAQNLTAQMVGRDGGSSSKKGKSTADEERKPNMLNKSLIAFSTIADGISVSGKNLLTTGQAAASTVVTHKYGEQAGSIASQLGGGVKNVGLVYIDVWGVSRRAVIKSVAKGMIVGKVRGGGQVVVGGGDGGVVSEEDLKQAEDGQQWFDKKTPDASKDTRDDYIGGPDDAPPPRYQKQ